MDLVDKSLAERFLLNQFPQRHRALLPAVLRNARAAAASLAAAEPILKVPSAQDNFGRLISYAVDLGIEKLIQSGRWPVDYRWCWFAKPTGRYLEVRFTHSVLSISQVSDPSVQPRDVRFRENGRINNQRSFNLPEFNDARLSAGMPSFLLVHGRAVRGDMESDFAHIGVPHPEHKRDWIYRTSNIMDMVQIMDDELPPVEETDEGAILTIKEEIEKWRRDNGQD